VHGGEQDTLSEAVVSLRTMATFVTWSSSGTEFVVKKLCYNDIFVDVLFCILSQHISTESFHFVCLNQQR